METVTLAISGMTCGHCVSSVREALEAVPGVQVEHVRIDGAEVRLDAAKGAAVTDAVLAAVQDAGYEATVEAPPAGATPKGSAGCACCVSDAAPAPKTAAQTA